jgi:hypothetical protein
VSKDSRRDLLLEKPVAKKLVLWALKLSPRKDLLALRKE